MVIKALMVEKNSQDIEFLGVQVSKLRKVSPLFHINKD